MGARSKNLGSHLYHFDNNILKTKRKAGLFKYFCNRSHGLNVACKINLYKMYIRPTIEYGLSFLKINKGTKTRLEICERKILKMFLNLPVGTNSKALMLETNLSDVSTRSFYLQLRAVLKVLDSRLCQQYHALFRDNSLRPAYWKKEPFRPVWLDHFQSYNIHMALQLHLTCWSSTPPLTCIHTDFLEIKRSGSGDMTSWLEYFAGFLDTMQQPCLQVATDASVKD